MLSSLVLLHRSEFEFLWGDTAKFLSEKFGRILQDKESISVTSNDTSLSRSKQLEQALLPSVISTLSSGEFVGIVADNPDRIIALKADFQCFDPRLRSFRSVKVLRTKLFC